jgi:cyclic-di-GMP phosphodiesterase TipF (flagellum assembly factor)
MARVFGRNAGLWATFSLGVVVLGPLAAFSPTGAAVAIAGGSILTAFASQLRLSRIRGQCDTLSREVNVLSKRLLALEQAPTALAPSAAKDGLRAEVNELTVEIGLLSGIVRDLSAVVRSQDSEIAQLRALPRPVEAAPPAPTPAPPAAAVTVTPPAATAPAPTPMILEPLRQPERVLAAEAFRPAPVLEAPVASRPIPPRPPAPPAAPSDTAIITAFESSQVEVYLQPVITLPQRKVVAYEALARLRLDDLTLEPEQFLPVLERHGRTTELDRRMLMRAGTIVRHLAKRGSDARVTYGLSPLSLFEPGFLKDIGRMTGDDQILAALEIALPQASWRGLDSGQLGLLAALRGRIGFCLDRPNDLRFDVQDLAHHHIGQVKVPADLLLRPAPGPGAVSDIAIEDIAPALARARVRLVVTDVAHEADVPDLIDLNVPFAQGAVFAPARPVRGEILADMPQEDPPPPADDPGPERRPFRSLLRRAS